MNATVKYFAIALALAFGAGGFVFGTHDANASAKKKEAAEEHGQATAEPKAEEGVAAVAKEEEATSSGGHGGSGPLWAYEGKNGPKSWGRLSRDFRACDTGGMQSPIDVASFTGESVDEIEIDYRLTPLTMLNNGHTIELVYEPGSGMTVGGKRFELLQLHFHSPSEHAVKGQRAAMEVHFVHKSADGQLAVIGAMMEAGGNNRALEEMWAAMPKRAGAPKTTRGVLVNARDLLPNDTSYYRYMGSLTTPPCSEGVNWYVLSTPISVGVAQVQKFASVIGNNARPLQGQNNRLVLAPSVGN